MNNYALTVISLLQPDDHQPAMSEVFKILLVDDEPDILEFIKYNLENEGYEVHTADNGNDGINIAREVIPDLILLDVMMPGLDGYRTCSRLRALPELKHTIIAFLTAKSDGLDEIEGFAQGADDYITKPVKPAVLMSRIKGLLRRFERFEGHEEVSVGALSIDRERFIVKDNDQILHLPKKEFELLSLLMSNPGKVFSREEIFHKVWGSDVYVGDRTIDVHIRKLRKKIKSIDIITIKGVGYKIDH